MKDLMVEFPEIANLDPKYKSLLEDLGVEITIWETEHTSSGSI